MEWLTLFSNAASVIGAFQGSAKAAKLADHVQDAVSVVTALTPLVKQFGAGHDVTPDEVRQALGGMDQALADFDALIAARS